MIKRMLMALGLGLAMLGGGTLVTHAAAVATHPAVIQADLTTGATEAQTADPDPSAPCATDAAGNETGDCQNSQNASGPEDNSGAPDAPETGAAAGQ